MKRIIILEDLLFDFTHEELETFRRLWRRYNLMYDTYDEVKRAIARDMYLAGDNVTMIVVDQLRKGLIKNDKQYSVNG